MLVLIGLVFQVLNPHFLSADNLVNLTQQSAATGVIALGVVLTLHVGQIDLSVGAVSGLAAAVVAVGSVQLGWPLWLAVAGRARGRRARRVDLRGAAHAARRCPASCSPWPACW